MLFFSFGYICLILAIIINYSTNNMKHFFTFDGICLSRIACCLFLALAMGNAHAQKIDFDTSTTNPNPTSDGFTSWCPGEISSGNTAQSTFTGVTVTISHGSGTTGNLIKENRWKDGTNSGDEERKLISDGIYSTNSGSHVSGGKVAITITVKGLSAGTHTLQAYHNNVDFTDGQYSLAPIYVSVGGTDVVSGIAQTARATTLASCAKTYVSFNVASSSTEVAITYYTITTTFTSTRLSSTKRLSTTRPRRLRRQILTGTWKQAQAMPHYHGRPLPTAHPSTRCISERTKAA